MPIKYWRFPCRPPKRGPIISKRIASPQVPAASMKGADMAGPEFQARLQKALDLYAKVLEREPSNYMAKMNTCCMSIRRRASPAQVRDCATAALALSYRSLNLVRCVG